MVKTKKTQGLCTVEAKRASDSWKVEGPWVDTGNRPAPLLEGLGGVRVRRRLGPCGQAGALSQLLARTAVGPEFGELSLPCLSRPTAPSADGPDRSRIFT